MGSFCDLQTSLMELGESKSQVIPRWLASRESPTDLQLLLGWSPVPADEGKEKGSETRGGSIKQKELDEAWHPRARFTKVQFLQGVD